MSKNKRKIKTITLILILILGTIFNLYFSTLLHELLSKEISELTLPSFKSSIYSLKGNKNHLYLFMVFQLTIILGSILYLITNNKPYQSDLIKITPNIMTPAPAGQKQFGSARWMTKEEKEKVFSICVLKKNDKLISYLIKHGYDDIETEKVGDENI
ncbi:MAG: hypothetical protein M0Q14_04670 [Tissierellaceae bacterium]|nr:hypothetical protein [Tissierellaceae bacterium]